MIYPFRRLLALIGTLSLAAVGLALVSQYRFDMPPCAWCVLQRLIYLIIAALCLIGSFAGNAGQRVTVALAGLFALGGVASATYQFTVASKMLSCDQTLADKFMSWSGLDSALPSVFGIYATCMDAAVSVLGVEYSLWSLGLFSMLALLALRVFRQN